MNNNDGAINFRVGLDNSQLAKDANQASSQLRGIGNAILPVNMSLIGLAASLGLVAKAALDFSRQFETAFAEVQTISLTARENADDIKNSILEMTTRIPIGAIDATKALYEIVSAGYDGAEAMNILEVSAKAAVAGVSTTALTSDLITTVLNSYKISATDAMSVSDKLFKTVELGKTTMSELGQNFAQVAAMAAANGVSLDDLLAAYSTMTLSGTKTAEATTQIKAAINSTTKILGAGAFAGRTFSETLQALKDKAAASGEQLNTFLPEMEAVNAVLKNTGSNAIVFSNSLEKIKGSAGSTDAAANLMTKTFDNQATILTSKLNIGLSKFGDVLKYLAGEPMGGFNRVLDIMTSKIDAVKIKGLTDDYEAFKFSLRGVTTEEEAQAKIAEKINALQKKQIEQGIIVRAAEKNRPSTAEKVAMGSSEMIGQFTGLGSTGTFKREATFEAETANYKAITKQINDLTALRKDSAAIRKATGEKTAEEIKAEADALKATKKEVVDREKEIVEAMKTATGKKLKMLAQELVALQKIKDLQEKLIELAVFEAKYAKGNDKTPTVMVGKTGQLVTTKDPTKYKTQDVVDDSKKSIAANDNQIKSLNDDEEDRLKKQVKLREDVFFAAESLTGVLVKNGMLSEEQGAAISESLNGFKALASGDFVGAAMTIVSQIASMFPSQAEQFQDRIDKINTALKEQQRLIELSDRRGGQEVGRLKEIELLKEKQKAHEEALVRAEDKRSGKIFKIGPVYKGYVKDVRELTAAVLEDKQAVEDATIALADFYTGGTTENTISSAIRTGFEDGKQSALDFASTFEDFMRTAINSSLEELSKPEIALWYKEFAADMASGGGLDEAEKNDLKAKWDKIAEDNAARRDAAYEIAGMDPLSSTEDQRQASSKGISSMSQESADELNGRFTAIQGHTFSISEGVKILTSNSGAILKSVMGIETNTARLEAIQQGIEQINLKGITLKK